MIIIMLPANLHLSQDGFQAQGRSVSVPTGLKLGLEPFEGDFDRQVSSLRRGLCVAAV